MTLALGLALAYLAGSFPTAYLVGRARGVDLGTVGSGNYGATNVFRLLGAGPASVALAVDVAKGFLPVVLVPRLLPVGDLDAMTHAVLVGLVAVLGHVFSLFLGFRGGKGVGTAAGVYLALAPWAVILAGAAWGAVVLWRRIVSLASLTAAVVLSAAVWALNAGRLERAWPLVAVTTILAAFVFWTHRHNVGRLRRGEEARITVGRARG